MIFATTLPSLLFTAAVATLIIIAIRAVLIYLAPPKSLSDVTPPERFESSMSTEAYDRLDAFMSELEEIVYKFAETHAREIQIDPIHIEIKDVEFTIGTIRSAILREAR